MKKTNKLRCENTMLTATGDQALATGNLVTTTTALNIADGQLGVMSYDPNSATKTLGAMLVAGNTATQVQAIKVVRGTPKSNKTQTVSLWEEGDKAYQESGIIRRNNIQAVSVKKADFGQWGGQVVSGFPAMVNDIAYGAWLNIDSTRIDKSFPRNDNTTYAEAPVINFTTEGTVSSIDFVLQSLATRLNSQSKLIAHNGVGMRGNKDFIVLGVKILPVAPTAPTVPTLGLTGGVVTSVTGGTGGSGYYTAPTVTTSGGSPSTAATITATISAAGVVTGYTIVSGGAGYGSTPTAVLAGGTAQAIGTITPTTNVTVETVNGVDQVIQFGYDGVAALADLVQRDANLTSSSAIIPMNSLNAGTFLRVDALIVLGVPHTPAAAYDDVLQTQVTPKLELTPTFNVGVDYLKTTAPAREVTNSGRQWLANWQFRPGLMVHTMQTMPMGDYFLEGLSYINTAKNYTNYTIEFFDDESTIYGDKVSQKKLTMLFPCELLSSFTANVTNVATRLAAGSSAYPMSTSNDAGTGTASAVTVASVEAILTAWLESARTTGTNFKVTGDAVAAGTYLS